MRLDLYTKTVLTIIALALVLIASSQYVHPAMAVEAQGSLAGIQFSGSSFFDTRTGDVWIYDGESGRVLRHFRIGKLGEPALAVPVQ